jgi:putative component of toxin-antitoxin plasmid stabilization module
VLAFGNLSLGNFGDHKPISDGLSERDIKRALEMMEKLEG